MKKPLFLRLNLQHFAEDDPIDPPADPHGGEPEKRFSQAELDEIIAKRLERERKKLDEQRQRELDDAERKKLEEQNEFKSLYEKTQAELESLRRQAEQAQIESTKTNLLVSAGYTGEQLERVRKYLVGTNDDELKASLETLKLDIPPKQAGVDPNVGNPPKHTPPAKDLADEGRSAYERLKALGKIRR